MDHRFSGFLRRLSIILFWIILWQAAASLIRNHIFLVGPADTRTLPTARLRKLKAASRTNNSR